MGDVDLPCLTEDVMDTLAGFQRGSEKFTFLIVSKAGRTPAGGRAQITPLWGTPCLPSDFQSIHFADEGGQPAATEIAIEYLKKVYPTSGDDPYRFQTTGR
jgi:hypothetical protein